MGMPTTLGQSIFNQAIADLGGGQWGSHDYGVSDFASQPNCSDFPTCGGSWTSRNPNPFLKVDMGGGFYGYISWPGANLAQLNAYLAGSTSGIMGAR